MPRALTNPDLKMCDFAAVRELAEMTRAAQREVNQFMTQWSAAHGAMSVAWLDSPGMRFTDFGQAWTMVSDGLHEMSGQTAFATDDSVTANEGTVTRSAAQWDL